MGLCEGVSQNFLTANLLNADIFILYTFANEVMSDLYMLRMLMEF